MPTASPTAFVASPTIFYTAIDRLADAVMTGYGPTITYLTAGKSTAYTFTGAGLTYGLVDGVRVMTGGIVTGIALDLVLGGRSELYLTGLALEATRLQAAITRDAAGIDNAAVERVLLPLGWTYQGTDGRDVLGSGVLSSDGTAMNLAGDDTVNLAGGNDDFWLGSGNDLAAGGLGNDRLDGGAGRDSLTGDAGADTLIGGAQADRLDGGDQSDQIDGGSGNDTLIGGRGTDTLAGGAGNDRFVFVAGDGRDQIDDFDLAHDRIDLAPGVDHALIDAGVNTIVTYGTAGDQILILGHDLASAAGIVFI